MKREMRALLLLSLMLVAPALLGADLQATQQADDLEARSKVAMSRNEVELSVGFICDAAKLDPKKYDKKCVAAQHHENEMLQAFDGYFAAGQAAMKEKDNAGAIRQFTRVSFGIRHDDAQRLIQEAKSIEGHPQALVANRKDLAVAQAAYDRGDLGAAETNARLVQVVELQPLAQQMLANIHTYQDAMRAGDAARQSGDLRTALQKYKFAAAIRSNGPGDPTGKMQQVDTLITASTPPPPPPKVPPTEVPADRSQPNNIAQMQMQMKIKAALAEGHAAETRRDIDGALQAYERALVLNPRQTDALAGRQRVLDGVQKAPLQLENALSLGLHNYYRSQLAEAGDEIAFYLTGGGKPHHALALFYLGATFASQAMLADPHTQADSKKLEERALIEFQQARCEHYQPIDRFLSPKVMALWNKSAC